MKTIYLDSKWIEQEATIRYYISRDWNVFKVAFIDWNLVDIELLDYPYEIHTEPSWKLQFSFKDKNVCIWDDEEKKFLHYKFL